MTFTLTQERHPMTNAFVLPSHSGRSIQDLSPTTELDAEADAVANRIESHPGMFALKRFGEQLRKRPLDPAARCVFFASTAEFFREVPGGILALALRLTDDWAPHDRFGAVEKGAQILYSAVDEFGLHELERGV